MLNKKILAVAVAAAFSLNASAAIDLNDSDTALVYATETIEDGDDIAANAAINLVVETGINLPASTTFYVRLEIENAVLAGDFANDAAGDGALTHVDGSGANWEGGGADGDSSIVWSYQTFANVADSDKFSVALGTNFGLTVTDTSMPVTFTYKLYEAVDSLDALNGTGTEEVSSQALASISFATGQDVSGSFSATNLTALVAEQFRKFDDGADADTAADSITAIGSVEYAVQVDVLAADDSSAVAIADVYTVSSDATLTGDFSFGTWTLNPEDDCSGVATTLTVDEDELGATTDAAADFTEQYLCIDASAIVSPDVIPKVTTAYSVSLDDNDGVSGSLGTISYDTTSILVPFITTFADNNHKFYIVNSGGTPASFSTTFATEDGTDYAVLDGSRGEVPAGGMVQLKAESMVEFTGETTRGSATIEIEAEASSIQATSQLTNRVNKGSDLTILTVQ